MRSAAERPSSPRAALTCWYVPSWTTGGRAGRTRQVPPVAKALSKRGCLEKRWDVTATGGWSAGYGAVSASSRLTCTGALANDGDIIGVTAKAGNVALHPLERGTLVSQEVVALVASSLELLRGEESWQSQAIAADRSEQALLRGDGHILDTNTNNRQPIITRQLDQTTQIVVRPARRAHNEATAMDPDKDRYLRRRALRCPCWGRDAQIQAIETMAVLLWLRDLVLDEQPDFVLKAIGRAVARSSDIRGEGWSA